MTTKVEEIDLNDLSLEDLAERFNIRYERTKNNATSFEFQLDLGKILLAARKKFTSDMEFGRWVVKNKLDDETQQHRNRILHLAAFFHNKDCQGIKLTAAYEISTPKYAEIAQNVYDLIVGKNFSVKRVKELLEKHLNAHLRSIGEMPSSVPKAISTTKIKPTFQQDNLENLTLDELSSQYLSIHKQSQLFKGLILLEARNRFPSNNEFHEWICDHGLSVDKQQSRTSFMNLAKFFKNRDMNAISITVAYLISAPINSDVAEEVYAEALGKNLPVEAVKEMIRVKKEDKSAVTIGLPAKSSVSKVVNQEDINSVIEFVNARASSKEAKILLLRNCIQQIQNN